MRGWRIRVLLLMAWTAGMGVWFTLYPEGDATTCGPEIYRECGIGLKVDTGLGQPGVVLLWGLGVVAIAVTWALEHRSAAAVARRTAVASQQASAGPAVAGARRGLRRAATVALILVGAGLAGAGVAAIVTEERKEVRGGGPRVEIASAALLLAVTPSGRRRNRARLTVRVRLVNDGARAIRAGIPRLLVAGASVRSDPRAAVLAGPLLRPVAPGTAAEGALVFEVAGRITDRLVAARRGRLTIAGRTLAFPFTGQDDGSGGPHVRVTRAVLQLAITPSGRRRNRARLTVRVRLVNDFGRTIGAGAPRLLTAGSGVRPDPRATSGPGALLRPVAPDGVANETLTFEVGGKVTARLVATRRGRLALAGRTVVFRLVQRPLPGP